MYQWSCLHIIHIDICCWSYSSPNSIHSLNKFFFFIFTTEYKLYICFFFCIKNVQRKSTVFHKMRYGHDKNQFFFKNMIKTTYIVLNNFLFNVVIDKIVDSSISMNYLIGKVTTFLTWHSHIKKQTQYFPINIQHISKISQFILIASFQIRHFNDQSKISIANSCFVFVSQE